MAAPQRSIKVAEVALAVSCRAVLHRLRFFKVQLRDLHEELQTRAEDGPCSLCGLVVVRFDGNGGFKASYCQDLRERDAIVLRREQALGWWTWELADLECARSWRRSTVSSRTCRCRGFHV